jgi:pimeloyl-ACP methyl ester carboxylesterase
MQEKWEPTLTAQRDIALASDAPLEVVFLPGLLCDARLWAQQIDALGDVAHATVARYGDADTMEAMAAAALEQAPDGAFMLAGLSMGGYVAFEIMRQQPKRVLGLALISTSARPDTSETSEARRALVKQSKSDFPGVIDQLLPRLLHERRLNDAVLTSVVRSMAEELGPEVFRRQQAAIIARPDSRTQLHEIACPTLIVCGRDDKITPVEVHAEMAERIPGAHLSILEDCAHLATLEQPDHVARELRSWLTETNSAYALR